MCITRFRSVIVAYCQGGVPNDVGSLLAQHVTVRIGEAHQQAAYCMKFNDERDDGRNRKWEGWGISAHAQLIEMGMGFIPARVLYLAAKMGLELSRACPGHPCPRFTDDLHGSRLIGQ